MMSFEMLKNVGEDCMLWCRGWRSLAIYEFYSRQIRYKTRIKSKLYLKKKSINTECKNKTVSKSRLNEAKTGPTLQ